MNKANPARGSRSGDEYIDQTMAKFRATLARMDADPTEAARIRALAEKTDIQLMEQADELEGIDHSNVSMEGYKAGQAAADRLDLDLIMRQSASTEQPATDETLEGKFESYQLRARAELELAEAKREAEYIQRVAQLKAEKIELDAQRENLDRTQSRAKRGLSGWLLAIVSPAPIVALPLLATLGMVFAIFRHAPILVTVLLAAPVAFMVVTYAVVTTWSALKMMHRDTLPHGVMSSPERTLRLLLGSLGNEVAIERARSATITAAVRSTEPDQRLNIHLPSTSKGLEGLEIQRGPETYD